MVNKTLVLLEITSPTGAVWNRCFLTEYVPSAEDFQYYYNTLLDLPGTIIEMTTEVVPEDFNSSLLPNSDVAPSAFPACDLETTHDETQKRAQFKQYVRQVCEMERMRSSLKFMKQATTEESAEEKTVTKVRMTKQQLWFQDLLKTLDADSEVERDALLTLHESDETRVPIAWILTPCIADVRRSKGSRLITDADLGTKWAPLLGTPVCPDLIVSRRISTVGWGFQGDVSDALLRTVVNWYIKSQDTDTKDGLTPFLLGADKELARIMFTFKRTRVNERFLTEDREDVSDPLSQVYRIMKQLEIQLLTSSIEDPKIHRIGYDMFKKYLYYVFKNAGIPRDYYDTDPNVERILVRWVDSQMGFRPDTPPLVESWKLLWDLIVRDAATPARVNLFLTTLDSHDPLSVMMFTNTDKQNLATEWIKLYLETQTIPDAKERVKSVILQEQVRQWCAQYISEIVFGTQLMPGFIGPVCTRCGFYTKRFKAGRFTQGLKFKYITGTDAGNEVGAAEEESQEQEGETAADVLEVQDTLPQLKEVNTIQYTSVIKEEGGVKTRKRTVKQTVIAENDNARIEHFFAATTTEINLGSM